MDEYTWWYNEFQHTGADFSSRAEVEAYDERMRRLRDIDGEIGEALAAVDLQPSSALLEIGTGTGDLAIAAASRCAKVYAVDISEAMIGYAREKATQRGAGNIQFSRGGFLTYCHSGEPVDAVVSQLALHHLPDFWKAVALRRAWEILKPGGRFYLRDVVFSFAPEDAAGSIESWMKGSSAQGGEEFTARIATHVRDEDSTFDWIMDGLLRAAGFTIGEHRQGKTLATYLCTK